MDKVINIPPPVAAKIGESAPRDYGFHELLAVLLRDQAWGRSLDEIELNLSIRRKAQDANGELVLSYREWEALAAVARRPSLPYNPEVMARGVIEFVYAIVDAKSRPPG